MSNCVAFHTQIASIMEVLANAAVAEICQVVDDGYAVLRLEMSQYQKENKALKRRLQMMERQTVRRYAERTGARASVLNARLGDGEQVSRKFRGTTRVEGHFPVVDRVLNTSLERDNLPIVVDEDYAPAHHAAKRDELPSSGMGTDIMCGGVEEGRTEPLHVKEERLKETMENHSPQRELRNREDKMESSPGDDGRPFSMDTDTTPAKQEELTDQQQTRRRIWEVSGVQSCIKADSEKESVKALQHTGPDHRTGRLSSLDSEFAVFERPGQLGTYCAEGSASAETEDPCCSYSTETNSDSLQVHSEMQPFPGAEEGAGNSLSSLGSLDWKPDIVVVDSAPIKMEAEMRPAWNEGAVLGMGEGQQRPYEETRGRGGMQMGNVSSVCLPQVQMAVGDKAPGPKFPTSDTDETPQRVSVSEKRLFYTYFEKGFGRQKDSEMHQNVDVSERQFTCVQCGKHFAHSANLKRHQRVHTGEKPFSCTQCEKRFSHQHQLKMHQRVHTGERPFNCTHCGKRFTQSSHIKRHLSVHTGEML